MNQYVTGAVIKALREKNKMTTIQSTYIIFAPLLFGVGVVLLILAFTLSYKYIVQKKRCIARTTGTVRRYGAIEHGGKLGVTLPVVYYYVGGHEFKCTGPEYKSYVAVQISKPGVEARTEFSTDDEKFRVKYIGGNGVYVNPMSQMFPLGSTVDVYYDPEHPKLAYVMRYVDKRSCFYALFVPGIICILASFIILILLLQTLSLL